MFEEDQYTKEINSYFAELNKKNLTKKFTPDQFKIELETIFNQKMNDFSSKYKIFFQEKYKNFFEQEKEISTKKYSTYLTTLFHPDKSKDEKEKKKIKIILDEAKRFFLENDKEKLKKNNIQINPEELMRAYKNFFFISLFLSWNIMKHFLNKKIDRYLQETKYNSKKITFLTKMLSAYFQIVIPQFILLKESEIIMLSKICFPDIIIHGLIDTFVKSIIKKTLIYNTLLFFAYFPVQDFRLRAPFESLILKIFFKKYENQEMNDYEDKEKILQIGYKIRKSRNE